ncbi:MAG: zf-TFIIB domain-containing protein [Acidobacteria bacterium]|nr:zf-TFIIB domain-containing protein [Acidobacteriota bacterium]
MSVDLEDRGRSLENEYFQRKERELVEKMKAKLAEEKTTSLDLQCPKCDGTLHAAEYENITIDVCDKCSGVWLDAGELAQVAHHDKETGWFGKLFN